MDLTNIKEIPIKELVEELKSRGFYQEKYKSDEKFLKFINENTEIIAIVDWKDNGNYNKFMLMEYSFDNKRFKFTNYFIDNVNETYSD